ncbi:hypothetical protein R1sor_006228 [Riccia sorocarpa]|uniref:IMP-specific 5'-nucleotidase 1 n=1 Tax=Riccia sorocarpa TaxID=122646 RepID=A0ABD3HQC1_9MARC
MAFTAYTCGLCFNSYAPPLPLTHNSSSSRRGNHEEQCSRSAVIPASKQVPLCRLLCRGLGPGNSNLVEKVGFFGHHKVWEKLVIVSTRTAEGQFRRCRCEFGNGNCGQRSGESVGTAANVVGTSRISTLGYGISKDGAESQTYQDREGAIAPVAASSSSTSVVTAGVEAEVAEQPNSRQELLNPEIQSKEAQKKTPETDNFQPSTSKSGMRWSMLLSTAALEDAHLSRASSVTDAHVLRRKGRLKEQDGLIEFIISMHNTHSPFQVMEKVERWVREHLEDPKRSTLVKLVPSVGRFYTPLPLVRALQEYDEFASLSRRRYVPPNFAEIRHVLNIAQVHAIAGQLSLITFDADGTLYADGHHIQRDNKMIDHIIKLMQEGCHVAIVTAAGYPGEASRYEGRLAGLLAAFEDLELPPRTTRLFHVMGGECNYLLRVTGDYKLEFVPDDLWKTRDMREWSEADVQKLLDEAEGSLISAAARLRLPVELIRKPRAVGAIPKEPTIYEVLEEMALTVQMQLIDSKLPYCAFNGGNDVFVDVGNKSVGLEALMKFLRKGPSETLHVGDRFTVSGNDSATRSKCSILWVANPEETGFFTRVLLREVQLSRLIPYIE